MDEKRFILVFQTSIMPCTLLDGVFGFALFLYIVCWIALVTDKEH